MSRRREKLTPRLPVTGHWRASEYVVERESFDAEAKPLRIKAAPAATWERYDPFSAYKADSKTRVKDGPHVEFLSLAGLSWRGLLQKVPPKTGVSKIRRFTEEHGLLGLFFQHYREHLILPEKKFVVAPEAVIDKWGRLWRIDPATEGRSLFTKWTSKERDALLAIDEVEVQTVEELEDIWPATKGHALLHAGGMVPRVSFEDTIALPSEVSFAATGASFPPELAFTDENKVARRLDATGKPALIPESHLSLVPWEEARERFGALLVFDASAPTRVSVLSTAEPFDLWRKQAVCFTPPDTPYRDQLIEEINAEIDGVSRYILRDEEDGQPNRSWRCRSLLQAMYMMLFLDITNDNTIRKCQREGCSDYFRVGSQDKTTYCSARCATMSTSQRYRDRQRQEP